MNRLHTSSADNRRRRERMVMVTPMERTHAPIDWWAVTWAALKVAVWLVPSIVLFLVIGG